MTTVLVHGVPEDLHIWDELRAELRERDTVALGLPGFGDQPLPPGFTPSKDSYATWLTDEVARLAASGPIDLVGHDWGGILTLRLVMTRPELVRSFVTDAVGFIHPEFAWHALAKIWQTPGAGEKYMTDLAAVSLEQRTVQLRSFGVSASYARRMAEANPVRDRSILDLYRSATTIHVDWSASSRPIPPGLLVLGDKDPFAAPDKSIALATELGMQTRLLPNTGHFWPSQSPGPAAAILREFWASLAPMPVSRATAT
jgi:pimeloyl-ACP methyl ester carboxylesterase